MLLIQNKVEDNSAYQAGYEVGQFIGHNLILSLIIGVLFISLIIYVGIKIFKKLRNLGE